MRVALATAAFVREQGFDTDLPLALAALSAGGVTAAVEVWDEPGVNWDAYDLVVVRSCWDYVARREEFLAWAGSVARLANPAAVLRWNTDKRYLDDLAARGVPVVPTSWDPRREADLPAGTGEWVVKPSVSVGAQDTARWSSAAEVLAHVRQLNAAGRVAMVQPYVAVVDAEGETALVSFAGEHSHAARKEALLLRGEGVVQDRASRQQISAVTATQAQRTVAAAACAAAGDALAGAYRGPLLYARVDVVSGPDGPLLLELELTEPSLFLAQVPDAAARFAAGVAGHRA